MNTTPKTENGLKIVDKSFGLHEATFEVVYHGQPYTVHLDRRDIDCYIGVNNMTASVYRDFTDNRGREQHTGEVVPCTPEDLNDAELADMLLAHGEAWQTLDE